MSDLAAARRSAAETLNRAEGRILLEGDEWVSDAYRALRALLDALPEEGAAWHEYVETGATIWTSDRRLAEEEAERRYPGGAWVAGPLVARQDAEIARLTAILRECNAVCLCGCPASEHESCGEDGESCPHDDHECIRVAPAVLAYVNRLRSAPLPEAVKEALVRFGALMFREHWQDGNPGDIDGGAAQDATEECGLWHQVERHADGVECEWCGGEGPCGELTEAGLAALTCPGPAAPKGEREGGDE